MQPASSTLDSAQFLSVFGEYELLQLQEENRQLQNKVYHLKLPSIYECMRKFNTHPQVRCGCNNCVLTNMCPKHIVAGEDYPNYDTCRFNVAWRRLLEWAGANKIQYNPNHEDACYGKFGEKAPGAHIYYNLNGEGDRTTWNSVGWGHKLTSLTEDPRRQVWEKIMSVTHPQLDLAV
jgi:hypothetical protein